MVDASVININLERLEKMVLGLLNIQKDLEPVFPLAFSHLKDI